MKDTERPRIETFFSHALTPEKGRWFMRGGIRYEKQTLEEMINNGFSKKALELTPRYIPVHGNIILFGGYAYLCESTANPQSFNWYRFNWNDFIKFSN